MIFRRNGSAEEREPELTETTTKCVSFSSSFPINVTACSSCQKIGLSADVGFESKSPRSCVFYICFLTRDNRGRNLR